MKMHETVYVLGGNGMFAKAFKKFAPAWAEVILVNKDACNITSKENIRRIIANVSPYAVINTAAIVDELYAENHPEEAFKVNMIGAINVAEVCRDFGVRCVHIDTCFSKEPTNQYAFAKYAAYRYIESEVPKTYIARVGWLFGSASSGQFDGLIFTALKTGRALRLATCHLGSPTYMKDAVGLIFRRIKQGASGLEEVANKGVCNRYDFGMELAKAFGYESKAKELFSPTDNFPEKVKKPSDASIKGKMRYWKIAVCDFGKCIQNSTFG